MFYAAAVAVLFLIAVRVPAVPLSMRSLQLGKKEFWFLVTAMLPGLAAGVPATLAMQYEIPGAGNLAPAIFALIVLSVLVFAIGFSIVGRLPDSRSEISVDARHT